MLRSPIFFKLIKNAVKKVVDDLKIVAVSEDKLLPTVPTEKRAGFVRQSCSTRALQKESGVDEYDAAVLNQHFGKALCCLLLASTV